MQVNVYRIQVARRLILIQPQKRVNYYKLIISIVTSLILMRRISTWTLQSGCLKVCIPNAISRYWVRKNKLPVSPLLDMKYKIKLQLILHGHSGLVGHLGLIHVIQEVVLDIENVPEVILMDTQKRSNSEENEIVKEMLMKASQDLLAHTVNVIIS